MNSKPRLWIALLDSMAIPDHRTASDRPLGAFANAVVLATSAEDAEEAFSAALEERGFLLVETHELELYEKRLLEGRVNREMRKLARRARKTGGVEIDGLYLYPDDVGTEEHPS